MRLARSLSLAVLFGSAAISWAQDQNLTAIIEAPLESVGVAGNRQIPAEKILAIADLKLGKIISKLDLDAARERLMATAAFETVGYEYKPSAKGQSFDVTIEVHETDTTYPYRFERLPIADDALRKALREQEPLWGDQIPLTSVERYVDVIAQSGINVAVTWKIEQTPEGGAAVVFLPAAMLPVIAEVRFVGNSAVPTATLLPKISEVAIGIRYTEEALRARLDSAVRPLYEAQGRMRAAFTKIAIEKAEKLDGIVATVTVDEGPQYKLGEVRFSGVSDSEAAQIARSADLTKGETVNFDNVKAAQDKAEKKYRSSGYLHVKSEVERDIHDEDRVVNVTIALDLGALYRFGKLTIKGLDLLSEPEIRKAWGAMEGRPYQPDYADAFLDRLRAEKVFDNLGKTSAEPKINESSKIVDITLTFSGAGKDTTKASSPYPIPRR